jgi:predicted DNA-binding transcriptional regulator AlpA
MAVILRKRDALPESGYIRIQKLIEIIPFSESTIWRKVKKGTFPAPVKLSEQITGWRVEDIRAWMLSKELDTFNSNQTKGLNHE